MAGDDLISILPSVLGGFWFADEVHRFDGDPARHGRCRAVIEDAAERDRVARYLRGAQVIEQSEAWLFTLFRGRGLRREVPLSYYTDGTWIWSDACAYHLIAHHHAPQPELLDHIAASGYRCAPVPSAVLATARSALHAHRETADEQLSRRSGPDGCAIDRSGWANDPPTVPCGPDWEHELFGDTSPFTVDVEISLFDADWKPGRDAGTHVTHWLTEFCAREGIRGRRHEVFPVATEILGEFGLLDVDFSGIHLHFFPLDTWMDPAEYAGFADDIGARLFPIAFIEHTYGESVYGTGWLFADETGRIFTRYEKAWYLLGEDLGSALDLIESKGRPAEVVRGVVKAPLPPAPRSASRLLPDAPQAGEWTRLNARRHPFEHTTFSLDGGSFRLDSGYPDGDARIRTAIAKVDASLARKLGWRRASVRGEDISAWLGERAVEIAETCPGAFRRLGPLGDELGPPSADDIRAWFLSKGSSHFDLRRTRTLAAGTVAFGDGRRGYVVAGTDASVRDELIHRLHNAVRRFERALRGRELRVLERKDVTRDDPHGQLVVTADTAAGALRISLAEEGWFVAPDTPGAESRRLRRLDKTTDVRVKGRDSFDDLAHDIHAILIADALRD